MKYMISQLNREVELDDRLLNEYVKYSDLAEYQFCIAIRTKFGNNSSNISDEELSLLCNEVLLGELKALTLLPKALEVISKHRADLKESAKNGKLLEFDLKKDDYNE